MEHVSSIGGKKYSGTILKDQRGKFHWTRGGLNIGPNDTVPRSTGIDGNGSCCSEYENCGGFESEVKAVTDFDERLPKAASTSP